MYTPGDNSDHPTGVKYHYCALLLNPICKVHFTRPLWNTIDVIIGIGLLTWTDPDLVTLKQKKLAKNNFELTLNLLLILIFAGLIGE